MSAVTWSDGVREKAIHRAWPSEKHSNMKMFMLLVFFNKVFQYHHLHVNLFIGFLCFKPKTKYVLNECTKITDLRSTNHRQLKKLSFLQLESIKIV